MDVQQASLSPALTAADPLYATAEPLVSERPTISITRPSEEV